MIVAAHQPHFLPWLGYINKVASADVFVWLDTVQYRKNYFQNRTRIMGADGVERWLTLPVHAHLDTAIGDVTIADPRWRTKVERTIEQTYARAPHFAATWPALRDALRDAPDCLAGANLALFRVLLASLALDRVRLVEASTLGVDAEDPTDRLVALCRALGATRYIAGKGGRGYMRLEAFDAAGIEVVWQAFDPARATYPRAGGAEAAGLSVVDALFHVGPERTRAIALSAWRP
ncbi:MAG TPA: WbqC family protein [Gemmatimonadaceae bacterium]